MKIYGNAVGHPLPDPRKGMTMSGPINMNGQAIKGLNAPTEDDEAVNWGSVKNLGKAKAGFIYPLASAVVPDGFLLCDGAAYARSEYPELFAAIGTMYGSGDGATTFNVPDLRGRVPAGSSENHPAGEMVGEETHKLTVDEMPSHMHKLANPVGYGSGDSIGYAWSTTIPNYGNMETQYVGGDQPHNNMQPTTYIHGYIIATGKGTGVSVADIILGAQALPLGLPYGGVGATDPKTARENLEITPENIGAEPAGAIRMELLWENASPTSDFEAQEIIIPQIINANDNSFLGIVYDGQSGVCQWGLAFVKVSTLKTRPKMWLKSTIDLNMHRTIDINFTTGKITIGSGYLGDSANGGFCVPVNIFLFKGVSA